MVIQHMVYAVSMISQYDSVILMVFVGIAMFVNFSNEPLLTIYVVYSIGCYRKICHHLTGFSLRFFVIGYASVKRIEVQKYLEKF